MKKSPSCIVQRSVAAIIGGFINANLSAMALFKLIPGDQTNAILLVMITSFLCYALIVIWVFAAANIKHVYIGLLSIAVLSLSIWKLA